jgi:uncharacterized iron-regulated protein
MLRTHILASRQDCNQNCWGVSLPMKTSARVATLVPIRVLCILFLLMLAGCGWVEEKLPTSLSLSSVAALTALSDKKPVWQSPLFQKHHLVGRIWHPSSGQFIEQDELAEVLIRSAFILLGEKHDNPDHHILQARLIKMLATLGRRPSIVWEMIPESKQYILDESWARYAKDADALGAVLGWDISGWPAWSIYKPVAHEAMAAHLPMYAASLSKSAIRSIARGKPSFEFARRRRRLGLLAPFPKKLRQRSIDQLYIGHCELMPQSALGPLFNVQRARDAVFAEHMLTGGLDDGALLIAGDGHVRKDIGVPLFLIRHQPNVKVTTVAFVEVQDGVLDPNDYAENFSAPVMPFDYVWFTPRADAKDHCAALRKKWQKSEPGTEKAEAAKPSRKALDDAAPAPEPKAAPKSEPEPKPEPNPEPEPKAEPAAKPDANGQPDLDEDELGAETGDEQQSATPASMEDQPEMADPEERPAIDVTPVDAKPNSPPVPRSKPPRPTKKP